MTNAIHDHFVTDQRPPSPILRNMAKHPMFDLIPLTRTRWKVPHVDRYADLVSEFLEFHLPSPIATGIAPPAIGGDQDGVRLGRRRLAPMPPPAPDGCDRTLCGVVIDPHTHPAVIVGRIVHAIRTNLAQFLVRKIVRLDKFWLPLGLRVPAPIGKRTHEFLLFRIDRNDWLSRTLKHFHTAIDRAQWRIAVGMRRPLECFARAL